ncbi:hypothetical protein [Geodermatophilus amargosae]|uniref:hypothetical protein n=1 Tax=Geodermatophilus amargosae TaxID=1296565 RepID=UPI001114EB64|nr:hypothetical protein [Geodermatophilus amargosae]
MWADWGQQDSDGRVWTFAGDSDQPDQLDRGVLVHAGPADDVRPAVVVDMLAEPWRTVVLLQELTPQGERPP